MFSIITNTLGFTTASPPPSSESTNHGTNAAIGNNSTNTSANKKKKRRTRKKRTANKANEHDNSNEDDEDEDSDDDAEINYLATISENHLHHPVTKMKTENFQNNHLVDPLEAIINDVSSRCVSTIPRERVAACVMAMWDRGMKYDDPEAVLLQLSFQESKREANKGGSGNVSISNSNATSPRMSEGGGGGNGGVAVNVTTATTVIDNKKSIDTTKPSQVQQHAQTVTATTTAATETETASATAVDSKNNNNVSSITSSENSGSIITTDPATKESINRLVLSAKITNVKDSLDSIHWWLKQHVMKEDSSNTAKSSAAAAAAAATTTTAVGINDKVNREKLNAFLQSEVLPTVLINALTQLYKINAPGNSSNNNNMVSQSEIKSSLTLVLSQLVTLLHSSHNNATNEQSQSSSSLIASVSRHLEAVIKEYIAFCNTRISNSNNSNSNTKSHAKQSSLSSSTADNDIASIASAIAQRICSLLKKLNTVDDATAAATTVIDNANDDNDAENEDDHHESDVKLLSIPELYSAIDTMQRSINNSATTSSSTSSSLTSSQPSVQQMDLQKLFSVRDQQYALLQLQLELCDKVTHPQSHSQSTSVTATGKESTHSSSSLLATIEENDVFLQTLSQHSGNHSNSNNSASNQLKKPVVTVNNNVNITTESLQLLHQKRELLTQKQKELDLWNKRLLEAIQRKDGLTVEVTELTQEIEQLSVVSQAEVDFGEKVSLNGSSSSSIHGNIHSNSNSTAASSVAPAVAVDAKALALFSQFTVFESFLVSAATANSTINGPIQQSQSQLQLQHKNGAINSSSSNTATTSLPLLPSLQALIHTTSHQAVLLGTNHLECMSFLSQRIVTNKKRVEVLTGECTVYQNLKLHSMVSDTKAEINRLNNSDILEDTAALIHLEGEIVSCVLKLRSLQQSSEIQLLLLRQQGQQQTTAVNNNHSNYNSNNHNINSNTVPKNDEMENNNKRLLAQSLHAIATSLTAAGTNLSTELRVLLTVYPLVPINTTAANATNTGTTKNASSSKGSNSSGNSNSNSGNKHTVSSQSAALFSSSATANNHTEDDEVFTFASSSTASATTTPTNKVALPNKSNSNSTTFKVVPLSAAVVTTSAANSNHTSFEKVSNASNSKSNHTNSSTTAVTETTESDHLMGLLSNAATNNNSKNYTISQASGSGGGDNNTTNRSRTSSIISNPTAVASNQNKFVTATGTTASNAKTIPPKVAVLFVSAVKSNVSATNKSTSATRTTAVAATTDTKSIGRAQNLPLGGWGSRNNNRSTPSVTPSVSAVGAISNTVEMTADSNTAVTKKKKSFLEIQNEQVEQEAKAARMKKAAAVTAAAALKQSTEPSTASSVAVPVPSVEVKDETDNQTLLKSQPTEAVTAAALVPVLSSELIAPGVTSAAEGVIETEISNNSNVDSDCDDNAGEDVAGESVVVTVLPEKVEKDAVTVIDDRSTAAQAIGVKEEEEAVIADHGNADADDETSIQL